MFDLNLLSFFPDQIDDVSVTNASCKEAENLFRFADQHVKICAVQRASPDEVCRY